MTDKVLIDRAVLEQALDTLEMMGTPSPLVFLPDEIKSWQAVQAALRAALEQPHESPYGECDECGTPYSYDPTDGGSICVRCMKEKLATKQPQVEQEPVAYFYTASGRIVSTEATENLMQQMTGEPGKVPLYLHPQPQVEQEPYLWHDPVRDQFWNREDAQYMDMSGTIPLYIHPQTPRKPLTDEQIHDCFQHKHRDKLTERRMITRAIEAAHGIKEQE